MDEHIKEIIVKYGRDIICSDAFQKTFEQVHHKCMTVGDHMLSVTAEAVRLCLPPRQADDKTLKGIVTASLCHDLGIMGRAEKYNNNAQCFVRHPTDSILAYKALTGEDDIRIIDAINCHMFPLKPRMPRYREGWVLTWADKVSAVKERLGRPPVSKAERDEILAMAQRKSHGGPAGAHDRSPVKERRI